LTGRTGLQGRCSAKRRQLHRRHGLGILAQPVLARAALTNRPTRRRSFMPAVELIGVNKWYGAFHVLKDINLGVEKGEKIVICGPSGSGKSTLIRCINRLETHQKGQILVEGTELTENLKQIEAIRAQVGMVFQSFNLFPHLTVMDNLCL